MRIGGAPARPPMAPGAGVGAMQVYFLPKPSRAAPSV